MRDIFSIKSEEEFEAVAMQHFYYQADKIKTYKEYLSLIGVNIGSIKSTKEIPFLPIELFKSHKICDSDKSDVIFTSSGTSSSIQSHHYVADLRLYEESFLRGFAHFYGEPNQTNIYALLPSYLEREGSSLIYMMQKLIEHSYDGDFFLYNYDALIERLKNRDRSKLTFLFGVTFALLDLIEQYENIDLHENVVVMETGGMKGRREEIPREKLHEILTRGLNVDSIHSEYGMCELLSQSYSSGNGVFVSPPWKKIVIRSLGDPFKTLDTNQRGGINIIDLANYHSCSFLQTQDKGQLLEDGSFTVEGRIDNSDIRGCNLLV